MNENEEMENERTMEPIEMGGKEHKFFLYCFAFPFRNISSFRIGSAQWTVDTVKFFFPLTLTQEIGHFPAISFDMAAFGCPYWLRQFSFIADSGKFN